MITSDECLLKADNYAAAARLETTEARHTYVRMAASWRSRAIRIKARAHGLYISRGRTDDGFDPD
jgi:hypothetical protein